MPTTELPPPTAIVPAPAGRAARAIAVRPRLRASLDQQIHKGTADGFGVGIGVERDGRSARELHRQLARAPRREVQDGVLRLAALASVRHSAVELVARIEQHADRLAIAQVEHGDLERGTP
jgi:hypothetical protein